MGAKNNSNIDINPLYIIPSGLKQYTLDSPMYISRGVRLYIFLKVLHSFV